MYSTILFIYLKFIFKDYFLNVLKLVGISQFQFNYLYVFNNQVVVLKYLGTGWN